MPAGAARHLLDGAPGQPRTTWLPGREAVEMAPHAVRDHTGAWHRGDLVVLCTGAAHTGVAGPHLAALPAPAGAPGPAADDADRAVRRRG